MTAARADLLAVQEAALDDRYDDRLDALEVDLHDFPPIAYDVRNPDLDGEHVATIAQLRAGGIELVAIAEVMGALADRQEASE